MHATTHSQPTNLPEARASLLLSAYALALLLLAAGLLWPLLRLGAPGRAGERRVGR